MAEDAGGCFCPDCLQKEIQSSKSGDPAAENQQK
jgi:hypothetical protein